MGIEPWLLFTILSYLSYAISTSIDKYMMNIKYDLESVAILKNFFDCLILFIFSVLVLTSSFDNIPFVPVLILGIISAVSWIYYYKILKTNAVGTIIPYYFSGETLVVFLSSLILFKETATLTNGIGVVMIILGIFLLSKKIERKTKNLQVIPSLLLLIVISAIGSLLIKIFLADIEPIKLATGVYGMTTILLVAYTVLTKKRLIENSLYKREALGKIFVSAVFGAIGTGLIYTALSIGTASKVYALSGSQSAFIVVIAAMALKEKVNKYQLLGVALAAIGVYLIST